MTDDTVEACPHCDSAGGFKKRLGQQPDPRGNPEEDYYCGLCQRSFDEPKERPPKGMSRPGGSSRVARQLARMDPEDLGLSAIGERST